MHQKRQGHQHFEYFLQTQILWDETMAQSAHQFIAQHPDTQLSVGIDEKEGQVVVMSVGDDTHAQKAGLQVGDIITRLAGQEIRALVDLKWVLYPPQPTSYLEQKWFFDL